MWRYAVFFILPLLTACAARPPSGSIDADVQTWVGTFTGMAQGDFKLLTKQAENEKDEYSFTGSSVINVADAGGYGPGTITSRLKGQVKDGRLQATIAGSIQVQSGSSDMAGEMSGIVSKTQASGTWSMRHSRGALSGNWTAEKVPK